MKIINIVTAVFILTVAHTAFAGKIVVFDAQQAILQTDLAKQRIEELQKKPEYAKLSAEFEGLKVDLEALRKDKKSKSLTWSPEQLAEHDKNVQFVEGDAQRVFQKLQKENDDVMKVLAQQGQQQIPVVLDQLVKSEGIDMILRKEAAFVSVPAVDITPKVIAGLNKLNSAK